MPHSPGSHFEEDENEEVMVDETENDNMEGYPAQTCYGHSVDGWDEFDGLCG